MRIEDLVPIEDCDANGESLIARVFGCDFFIVDEHRSKLTTGHNRGLLQEAMALLDTHLHTDAGALVAALERLGAQAETVRQADYDRARERLEPHLDSHACFDHAHLAGCLN